MERGISALAYETVQEADGSLPLLKPMSEVAGRMAPIVGAYYLARVRGGRGNLLPGVPGVAPGNVLILGGGTVGSNAARVSAGLGAMVTIMDINLNILEHLGNILPPNVVPLYNDSHSLEKGLREAHLVVGAVLIPGAKAPKLITREHLKLMKPGSVIVDVAIDQGGCTETSHPTTHADPILCGRRYHPLLRCQYARSLRPHLHVRVKQLHGQIRTAAGQQRIGKGLQGELGAQKGPEPLPRSDHLQAGRRSLWVGAIPYPDGGGLETALGMLRCKILTLYHLTPCWDMKTRNIFIVFFVILGMFPVQAAAPVWGEPPAGGNATLGDQSGATAARHCDPHPDDHPGIAQ